MIERAFGLLKSRWRALQWIHAQSITRANAMIEAACVLHNYGLRFDATGWRPFEDELARELREEQLTEDINTVLDAAGMRLPPAHKCIRS